MADNIKDFQETLHEVLNTRLNSKSKQEMLLQTVLKKSDKASTIDFQEVLRKSIKPLSDDKMKKDLKPLIKKAEDPIKKVDTIHKVNLGADLDKVANDVEEEKDEDSSKENSSNSNNELTRREETLKQMYSVALDEYYTLREELYKYQIQDGNIAVDDRNYLKLLQYENYLRKCDTLFKQSNGSYISNQDESISKKENKYAFDAAKSEVKVVKQHEESINKVDRLNIEIENKADEIIELNEAVKNGNVPNYEIQIELLEKEYIDLNARMHLLKPNVLELYRQEEEKQQQEKDTTRIVGTMYEKRKDKLVIDADVVRLDKTTDKKHESLDNAAETEKIELENTNLDLANSYIDAAETALSKEDTNKAILMVSKAKELVGNKKVETIVGDKSSDFSESLKYNVSSEDDGKIEENVVSETEVIDKHLYNVGNANIALSNVQQECAKAVYTPEERGKNALAREANEGIEDVEKDKVKDKGLSR